MLCFWEASDEFNFEKVIVTTSCTIELQINIWYISFLDTWITTDKDGIFYFWDLLNHKISSHHHITGEPIKELKTDKSPEDRRENQDYKDNKVGESKVYEDYRDIKVLGALSDPKISLDLNGSLDHKPAGDKKFLKPIEIKEKKNGGLRMAKYSNLKKEQYYDIHTFSKIHGAESEQLNQSRDTIKRPQEVREPGRAVSFLDKTDASMISKSKKSFEILKNTTMNQVDRAKPKQEVVHYLLEITEISYIKLLAIASTDKHIRIWDVNDILKPRIIFCLNMVKGGVHQMRFMNAYQVLIVAGYENSIPVFSITPRYYDVNVVGRLVGHVSIVTALEIVDGTPMVLTADDTGCIKSWDIRSFHCFQTIEMSNKTIIGQLLSMENINKVAFIGCRLNFIEFDRSDKPTQRVETKQIYPIKAELNLAAEELLVCTNTDLKFIDINTGRLKKIYSHMISPDTPDEITAFRMIQRNHRFLLGDPRGDLMVFGVPNGEKIMKMEGHSLELVDVKVDTYNKMLVSAGADSKIIIQRERLDERKRSTARAIFEEVDDGDDINLMGPEEIIKKINREDMITKKNQAKSRVGSLATQPNKDPMVDAGVPVEEYEVLRTIVHTHRKHEITCLALSVYHNLMASASVDNIVFLYDYEYGKFLAGVELENGTSVTALEFINGFGILLICANNGLCYMLGAINAQGKQEFKLLGTMAMEVKSEFTITRSITKENSKSNLLSRSVSRSPSLNNSFSRTGHQSFEEIKDTPIAYAEKIYVALSLKGEHKDLEDFIKVQVSDTDKLQLNNCEVYFGLQNGHISIYQLTPFLQNMKIIKHANTRQNYNPFRTNVEDCSSLVLDSKNCVSLKANKVESTARLDKYLERSFFGHKGGFTSLALIKVPQELLLTTGNDKYVKVISKTGDCLAAWNVNHPLPFKWTLRVDSVQDMKTRVLFALKVIQAIFKRYYNLLYAEGKVFDLKAFLKDFEDGQNSVKQSDKKEAGRDIFQLTQVPPAERSPKVRVMTDEYLAKDFASGKLKDLYHQELLGPSLKQLDTKRRLIMVQQEWKDEDLKSKEMQNSLAKKEEGKGRKYSEEGMEQENFLAYIERARKLNVNQSERITNINSEFKKVENQKHKELLRKENKNLGPQNSLTVDNPPAPYKSAAKGLPAISSMHNTSGHGSLLEKHVKSKSKVDFFQFAEGKNLLNQPSQHRSILKNEISIDSTQVRLQKELENCTDFTEEGRVKRVQRATRNFIKEKVDFTQIMHNINDKLKRSQVKNLNSRQFSLPVLKTTHSAQAYNPFHSVLPKVDTKAKLAKGSKSTLLR